MTNDETSLKAVLARLEAILARIGALEADRRASGAHALGEIDVHRLELEMHNEALREVRGQLETTLARYADLYDFAPIPYLMLDRDATILEANLAASRM